MSLAFRLSRGGAGRTAQARDRAKLSSALAEQLSGMRLVFGDGIHEKKLTLTFGFLSSLVMALLVLTSVWSLVTGLAMTGQHFESISAHVPLSSDDGGWRTALHGTLTVLVIAISFVVYAGQTFGIAALVLVAAACLGAFLGFLFGVPRSLSESGPMLKAATPDANPPAPAVQPMSRLPGWHANTNLTQVSDWLTKILVGLSLVEAHQISNFAFRVDRYVVAAVFTDAPIGTVLVMPTLMIAGLILGFIYCYLFTQLFLAGLMAQTAEALSENIDLFVTKPGASAQMVGIQTAAHVLAAPISMPDSKVPSRVEARPTADQERAAQSILMTPLSDVEDPASLKVWARAGAILNEWAPSVAAYAKLLASRRTPEILLEAARVFAAAKDVAGARDLIEEAVAKSAQTDIATQARIAHDAAEFALYEAAPAGYKRALALLNADILAQDTSGSLHILHACAEGQRYKYEHLNGDEAVRVEDTVKRDLQFAMGNIRNRDWICYLLGRNPDGSVRTVPDAGVDDDDLYPFKDRKEFLDIVGLS